MTTHSERDKDNHECAFWHSARVSVLVLRQEEQRRETDLLDVHPDENVLHRLREEQSTGLSSRRLVELPEEEVLPEEVEEDKGDEGEAVDDRRDDRVRDRYFSRCEYEVRIKGLRWGDSLMTTNSVVAGKSVPKDTFRVPYLMLYTLRGVLPSMNSFT